MKKTVLLILAFVFLMCGCETKTTTPIKAVSIKNFSEFTDDFINKPYDYFYQFEFDYKNYDVRKIELNYYKDKRVQNNVFCFMRDKDDPNINNIQYIFLGYNFTVTDTQKRNVDVYSYLYGPAQPDKYPEAHSSIAHPKTRTFEYDNSKRLYALEGIEQKASKYYINPIILNAPINNEIPKDTTTSKLIEDGYELLVLEVEIN